MKVLIAEDHALFQRLLTATLSKWGYEALTVADGEEALKVLTSSTGPRLAILDWMMPKADGLEVCRQVRLAKRPHYVYLILLTAKTGPEDVVAGLEAGADDYVVKPVRFDELRLRLRCGCRVLEAEERQRDLERQLAQAQKLESIGHLASGIAHEINTPIQYIGDNGRFLEDAFRDLIRYLQSHRQTIEKMKYALAPEELAPVLQVCQAVDFSYLEQEIPNAIGQLLEGVDQVARIVHAMKEFSHPGPVDKQPINLNRAIESTVLVSRNEWKHNAELTTDLAPDLPLVPCVAGEFNQVILNLIVNAAQAIEECVGTEKRKGLIHISTRRIGAFAEIRIHDTGCGIPPEIQSKVFDPFFTTKPVGKGTGQGLTIAHSVVVQKHQGSIRFESEAGQGTTFVLQLPLICAGAEQEDSLAYS
jgi:signal transduction histidine kinase